MDFNTHTVFSKPQSLGFDNICIITETSEYSHLFNYAHIVLKLINSKPPNWGPSTLWLFYFVFHHFVLTVLLNPHGLITTLENSL